MELDPRKKAATLLKEFRDFAFKGNMLDLAVAVIIGTAFGKVVDSLVKQIFMPAISYIMPSEGGYQAWTLGRLNIGVFLGELLNFLLVALAVFIVIVKVLKALMKEKKKVEEAAPAGPPPLSKDQELLTEIRDLLKQRKAE